MLNFADFNEVYASKPPTFEEIPCKPPACFVGSYAPWPRLVRPVPST